MSNQMISRLFLLALAISLPTTISGCEDVEYDADGYCVVVTAEEMSFFDTSSYCDYLDRYTYYANEEDKNRVFKFVIDLYNFGGEYWTGGHDLFVNGVYSWGDFEYFINEQTLTLWAPERPTNSRRNNCIYIRIDDGEMLWYDGNCQSKKHGFCFD